MPLKDAELGKILLAQNYVTEADLKNAEKMAKDRDTGLKTILVEMGFLTQELYESALAEHYKLPFCEFSKTSPSPELIASLPEEIARAYSVLVIARDKNKIGDATFDPTNPFLEEALRLNLDQEIAMFPIKDTEVQ